jgi:hypothetical protein
MNERWVDLRCAKCCVPIPVPAYCLGTKKAARRLCKPCRAENARTVGRIPSQVNAAIPVSEMAQQVILGSILGDGHLAKPRQSGSNWGLEIKHALSQEDYLRWKAKLLGPLVRTIDYPPDRIRLRTVRHPFLTELAKLVVIEGRKSVPLHPFDTITELGLGIWYLDDGCLSPARVRPTGHVDKTTIRFSTCAFTHDENLALRALLKIKTQVDSTKCTWVNRGTSNGSYNKLGGTKRYEGIRLYAENANKFLKQVTPSLQNCGLSYKLDNGGYNVL